MKLQVFPNWCKKLGVIIFVIFSFLEGRDDFIEGWNAGANNLPINSFSLKDNGIFSFKEYFGEDMILLFGTLSLIGILIYMLSKEKIEDDYINKLRLESYQLAMILITLIALVLYVLGYGAYVELATVISVLLGTYLIIFAIKKRTV